MLINLMVNLRDSEDYPSALGACKKGGNTMTCTLDGGRGSFTLKGRDNALLLSISKTDLVLQGGQGSVRLSGTRGDDRVFLMASVSSAFCN